MFFEMLNSTPIQTSVFTKLKRYCDEHGYPQEIGHKVHNHSHVYSGGVPSTKSRINHSNYRFSVNGILDELPVTDETLSSLKEQQQSLLENRELFEQEIHEQQSLISQYQEVLTVKNRDCTIAIAQGDTETADKIDAEVFQIDRNLKRCDVFIHDRKAKMEALKPDLWAVECMITGLALRLQQKAFEAVENQFKEELAAFAQRFHDFRQKARDAGLDYHVFGTYSDYSDQRMMSMLISALGLKVR